MKHLKTYETIKNEPHVGDWAIIEMKKDSVFYHNVPIKKIENKILKIIEIEKDSCLIKVERGARIDKFRKLGHFWIDKKDIKFFSENKKDLEIYIDINKYNL